MTRRLYDNREPLLAATAFIRTHPARPGFGTIEGYVDMRFDLLAPTDTDTL
jgi:hypothetical protein